MTTAPRSDRRGDWLIGTVLPLEPWLRRQLERSRCPTHEHDDIIQQCFLKLLELDAVEHVADPRSYLTRMAHNLMVSRYRVTARLCDDGLAPLLAVAADTVPFEQAVDARRALDRVLLAYDALAPRARAVLRLRRLDGVPAKTVAAGLGLSVSAIEKELAFALRRLARAREPTDAGEGAPA